jgi:hypothetical protein
MMKLSAKLKLLVNANPEGCNQYKDCGGGNRSLKQVQDEYYEANKDLKVKEKELLAAAGSWKHVKMDTATKKSTIGAAMEYQSYDVKSALRSPKVPREVKDRYREAKAKTDKLGEEGDSFI